MPRQARLETPNTLDHVMVRGLERRAIRLTHLGKFRNVNGPKLQMSSLLGIACRIKPPINPAVTTANAMLKEIAESGKRGSSRMGLRETHEQPKPADAYRLKESSHREMLKPHIEVPGPIMAAWALGWQIWQLEPGHVVAHGGDIEGWHSQSAFSPDRKTGFVIMTNGDNGATMIWDRLLKPLVGEFVFS